jgi:hypothetical protein
MAVRVHKQHGGKAGNGVSRIAAVAGLAALATIHLLDLPGTIDDTPYIGWMYIGLIAAALVLAVALVRGSDTRVWLAAAALVASTMIAYLLSRTTGLPQSSDDIGNWAQPLGVATLLVGGAVLAVTGRVLCAGRRAQGDAASDGTGR